MKKEIKIFIDNQEIEYYELDDYLKNINCIYKEDGKWFIEYKEEDKKIKKLDIISSDSGTMYECIANKINEIIDYINKEK